MLTTSVRVAYTRLLAGQEFYVQQEDSIQIDPVSPEYLTVDSVKDVDSIHLRACSLKCGYEAIAIIAETSLASMECSPQQCLVLETDGVAHCFVFHKLSEGTAWQGALLYFSNRLQKPSDERELAAVFDLRVLPKVSDRWREFEVTLVADSGNSVERLVMEYSETNVAGVVEDFLHATCKCLCTADFQALVSLLQTVRQEDALLKETRFYHTLLPYRPLTGFAADENAVVEFKAACRLGDVPKCELQISLRLNKRKLTPADRSLELALSALQLQKLGLILQSVKMNQPLRPPRPLSCRRPLKGATNRSLDNERNAVRVKARRQTRARVIETARISLEPPSLDESPKDRECQVF